MCVLSCVRACARNTSAAGTRWRLDVGDPWRQRTGSRCRTRHLSLLERAARRRQQEREGRREAARARGRIRTDDPRKPALFEYQQPRRRLLLERRQRLLHLCPIRAIQYPSELAAAASASTQATKSRQRRGGAGGGGGASGRATRHAARYRMEARPATSRPMRRATCCQSNLIEVRARAPPPGGASASAASPPSSCLLRAAAAAPTGVPCARIACSTGLRAIDAPNRLPRPACASVAACVRGGMGRVWRDGSHGCGVMGLMGVA